MATDTSRYQRIKFNAWEKNANALFDHLQNIDITNRSSDNSFLDAWRVMLAPRSWTVIPWWQNYDWPWYMCDVIEASDWETYIATSEWKVYEFQWSLLHDFWSSVDPRFTFVNLPSQPTNTTTYTTPADASWLSIMKRDLTDPWTGYSNVWKFIFITGPDTATPINWQPHVGLFWRIEYYDSTSQEYWIASLWNQTNIPTWVTYRLFDAIEEYVCASTWEHDEVYIRNATVETLFTWLWTRWLRQASDTPTAYLTHHFVLYEWSYWTVVNNVLIWSFWVNTSGTLENPFRFVRTSQRILTWIKSVNQMFEFRDKIIIWWRDSIYYFDQRINPYLITKHYWILWESIVDVTSDSYFISSERQILSFNESYNWQIFIQDIWDIANNYIKSYWIFSSKVSASADSEKIYFSDSILWYNVVYHIKYKFWSLYTGYKVYRQVYSWWINLICSDAWWNPTLRIFGWMWDDDGTWGEENFNQVVSCKDIYVWDVSLQKEIPYIDIWFEDEDTNCYVTLYDDIQIDQNESPVYNINFSQYSLHSVKKVHHPRVYRISRDWWSSWSMTWKITNNDPDTPWAPTWYFYLVEVSVPISLWEWEDYIYVENVL